MNKRAFIIHGWDGYPDEGWFPWLKNELKQKDFQVHIPAMPEPAEPKIFCLPAVALCEGGSEGFFAG